MLTKEERNLSVQDPLGGRAKGGLQRESVGIANNNFRMRYRTVLKMWQRTMFGEHKPVRFGRA
jgi:hypothetical protein